MESEAKWLQQHDWEAAVWGSKGHKERKSLSELNIRWRHYITSYLFNNATQCGEMKFTLIQELEEPPSVSRITVEGFWTSLLDSVASVGWDLWAGFSALSQSTDTHCFFLSFSVILLFIYMYVWVHRPLAWPDVSRALALARGASRGVHGPFSDCRVPRCCRCCRSRTSSKHHPFATVLDSWGSCADELWGVALSWILEEMQDWDLTAMISLFRSWKIFAVCWTKADIWTCHHVNMHTHVGKPVQWFPSKQTND